MRNSTRHRGGRGIPSGANLYIRVLPDLLVVYTVTLVVLVLVFVVIPIIGHDRDALAWEVVSSRDGPGYLVR
jgi:hypothetical protein